jgi:hypothetical protein
MSFKGDVIYVIYQWSNTHFIPCNDTFPVIVCDILKGKTVSTLSSSSSDSELDSFSPLKSDSMSESLSVSL